jgi:hypothetical protein
MTLLSRYEAGDFEAVWQEIRSHSRLDEEFRAEVIEVAEAAMKRVVNSEVQVPLLDRAEAWQQKYFY